MVDASLSGVRLSHSSRFPERKPCAISLHWHGTSIEFIAEHRWTNAKGSEYQSGFEIQSIDPPSRDALRDLIKESGERASLYECHELIHGVWRKRMTTDPRQPESGFTVRSTESIHTIDFLRAAYTAGDRDTRERLRKFAELSIAHPERRYDT